MAVLGFLFFIVAAFLIVKLFYSLINNLRNKEYIKALPKIIVLLYLVLQLFMKVYRHY